MIELSHSGNETPPHFRPRFGRRRRRQGVLLLVILGLLAMFGLVAVAFVVSSGQALRTAEVDRRVDQYDRRADEDLHQAFMQAARGVPGRLINVGGESKWVLRSVIGPHSLLEDIFGTVDPREGTIDSPVTVAGGQLVELSLEGVDSGVIHRYAGNVLTITGGPAAGQSTRIVSYNPTTGAVQIVARGKIPFGADGLPGRAGDDDDSNGTTDDLTETFWTGSDDLQPGDPFLINGTPFSGTGFGYHKDSDLLNAWDPYQEPSDPNDPATWSEPGVWPYALLPNPVAFTPNFSPLGYFDPTGPGGANEDYDAPDIQNMILAAQIGTADGLVTIPSLHRTALIRYWCKKWAEWNGDPALATFDPLSPDTFEQLYRDLPLNLKRKITLRPLPEHHPDFTGSNPAWVPGSNHYETGFNPLWNYERRDLDGDGKLDYTWDWDVDNDGDGLPDGIWLDLGLPVRSMPDGRLYKPLFSILCVDLDGRLDLNASGCLAQTDEDYYDSPNLGGQGGGVGGGYFDPFDDGNFYYAGVDPTMGNSAVNPARGQGYGPPEINLRPLFDTLTEYEDFLNERYGPEEDDPGVDGDDPLSANMWYEYGGADYWGQSAIDQMAMASVFEDVTGAFGSPPNPQGDCAIGLDPGGRPLYARTGVDEQLDDPYESDFSGRAARGRLYSPIDGHFTAAEFERLMRPFDADATRLESRLFGGILDGNGGQALLDEDGLSVLLGHRREITFASRDVPCPSVTLTRRMREALRETSGVGDMFQDLRAHHPAELLLAKLLIENPDEADFNNFWAKNAPLLFPLELLAGLRMDVNRPFGNGRDDNASGPNGVVDELARIIRNPNASGPEDSPFMVDENYDNEIYDPQNQIFEQMPQVDAAGNLLAETVPFNHVNGIDVTGDGLPDPTLPADNADSIMARNVDRALARQLYARHLYVIALLAMDYRWENATVPSDRDKRVTRVVAQWAINVADFRDRDSIMTPFEYDVYPFTDQKNDDGYTWDVDGVIDVDPSVEGSDDNQQQNPYRALVWGGERPELLVNEALAIHDRRTEDLERDDQNENLLTTSGDPGDGNDRENDRDFDQRIKPQGSLFLELLNPWTRLEPGPGELYDLQGAGVDLTKLSAERNEPDNPAASTKASPVWRVMLVEREYFDEDPDDPGNSLEMDTCRFIYFVNPTLPASTVELPDEGGMDFYPGSSQADRIAPIMPGRYAVIGPGKPSDNGASTTYLGFRNGQSSGSANDTRRITLNPNSAATVTQQVVVVSSGGATNDSNDLNDADPTRNIVEGLTIKSPTAVVINQPQRLSISEPEDGYAAYTSANGTEYDPPLDVPQDKTMNSDLWEEVPADDNANRGLKDDNTFNNVKVVYLQRLANPMLPWDRRTNPYRTIDAMPVDLTCFNGVTSKKDNAAPSDTKQNDGEISFYTRERGEYNDEDRNNTGRNRNLNFWRREPLDRSARGNSNPPPAATNHYLNDPLHHTLGYLNDNFGRPIDTPGELYRGEPQNPMPWFTWNNRPFVSQLELLLVPTLNSSELLRGYQLAPTQRNNSQPYTQQNDPFPHLLNYFRSNRVTSRTTVTEFHRMLELLHVPSRFVGAETQGNPVVFGDQMGLYGTHNFRPPFNRISHYRDAGRPNLNTVYSENVWKGYMNYFHDTSPMDTTQGGWQWDELISTRRGYDNSDGIEDINADYPTRFAGAFRSSGGGSLVPLDELLPSREVNATLLREENARVGPQGGDSGNPLFETNSTAGHNDSRRNPYFRYQGLQRQGNLATTRSNVYAVWITVGYFEVQPWEDGVDEAHPDGYALGQELGFDSGEVKRHRAFYIFDRSIPVGFQRGYDHNVEKAILLKRFIE